jgi:hypothetical protein
VDPRWKLQQPQHYVLLLLLQTAAKEFQEKKIETSENKTRNYNQRNQDI